MTDTTVADANRGNWVDTRAPVAWRPYLRMMRADRPNPAWLLLLPCWWGLMLSGASNGFRAYDLWLAVAFVIGSVAMRGAGCCLNDIVDRNIDVQVERTRSRPVPSGAVSVTQAVVFMGALCLVGLAVLLTMNGAAIAVAFASLVFVAIYPFMKRITYWPQLFLGFAFNWGALVGWAAQSGGLEWPAVWLYLAGICWTIGYDTIYACQDKEDDALIGVKSTALRFGARTREWIAGFYVGAVLLAATALISAGMGWSVLLVAGFAAHLTWQVGALDPDDGETCLRLFRGNREAGLLLAGAIAVAALFAA